MSTSALQPDQLVESLLSLLADAEEQGLLDAEQVRIIALGPRGDHTALALFLSSEWDSYPSFDDSQAIGTIGISEWVLAQPGPTKQGKDELTAAVRATLRLAGPRLTHLPGHVALASVDEDSCTVQAFCHRHGGDTLMGLMEQRGTAKLFYPDVTLHEEGFTVFYPGGEVEGTAFTTAEPAVLDFRFDEMVVTRVTSDGVAFRMRDEAQDRHFKTGHLDEAVWPDKEQAERFLQAHLSRRPELLFDRERFPPLDEAEAVERWFANYLGGDLGFPGDLLGEIHELRGIAAARLFLERLPASTEGMGRVRARMAFAFAREGMWEEAWPLAEAVLGTGEEGWLYGLAPRILLMLGRTEQALEVADQMAASDQWLTQCYGLQLKALALTRLGRDEEAEAAAQRAIDERPRQAFGHYGMAAALQRRDPAAALAALTTAMVSDRYNGDYVETDFSDEGILAHNAFVLRLAAQRQAIKQAITEALVPCVLERLPETEPVDETRGWFRTTETPLEDYAHTNDMAELGPGLAAFASAGSGLMRLDVRTAGAPKTSLLGAPEGVEKIHLKCVCVEQGVAYCVDSGRLRFARLGEDLEWLGEQEGPSDENWECVAVEGGVLALASFHGRAFLYRVSAPGALELAGSFSVPGRIHGMELCEGLLYVADDEALVVLDVRDPAAPRVVAALQHDDKDLRSDKLSKIGAHVFIRPGDHERGTWCVDVSEPSAPRSTGELPYHLLSVHEAGDRIVAPTTDGSVVTLDRDSLEVRQVTRYAGEGEHPFGVHKTLWHDDRLVTIYDEEALVELERRPRDPWPLLEIIEGAEAPLREWVEAKLAAADVADGGVGAITLTQSWTWVQMHIHPPQQPIMAGSGEATHAADGELGELYPAYPANPDPPDELNFKERQRWGRNAARRWRELLASVLDQIKESDRFSKLASGRVELFVQAGDEPRLHVGTVLDEDKPWQPPALPETGLLFPPAGQLLGGYGSWRHLEQLKARVRSRPQDRVEVLALAAAGNELALQISLSLGIDQDDVFEAFVQAGERDEVAPVVFKALGPRADHDRVGPILERGFASEDPATILFAAKALGELDSDRVQQAIEQLLENDEEELALSALEQVGEARLQALVPKIIERGSGWNEHNVPRACALLLKAEHPEPLSRLHDIAAARKKLEDDSWGLFGDMGDDGPSATEVERAFVARKLARRVAALQASAADEPLWPPGVPQETTAIGWGKLMPGVISLLHDASQVPRFMERLQRCAEPGDDVDRAMVLPAIIACLQQADDYRELAFALVDVVLAAPTDVFSEEELKKAERCRQWTGVHRAWELFHAGELARARALVDQGLESNPNDPDVLFIDARLRWVQGTPEDCIARLEETLPRLSSAHRVGPYPQRAKLLNLYGCALDELERHGEALSWFEKAQLAHPDEPMFMANLAEIHAKLGNAALAREWAIKAGEGGHDSEVIRRLTGDG